jgi:hypothetical protein
MAEAPVPTAFFGACPVRVCADDPDKMPSTQVFAVGTLMFSEDHLRIFNRKGTEVTMHITTSVGFADKGRIYCSNEICWVVKS